MKCCSNINCFVFLFGASVQQLCIGIVWFGVNARSLYLGSTMKNKYVRQLLLLLSMMTPTPSHTNTQCIRYIEEQKKNTVEKCKYFLNSIK